MPGRLAALREPGALPLGLAFGPGNKQTRPPRTFHFLLSRSIRLAFFLSFSYLRSCGKLARRVRRPVTLSRLGRERNTYLKPKPQG